MSNHDISETRPTGEDDYPCDLRHLPHLSDEERDRLIALLTEAQAGRVPSHVAQQAHERLIEGHLWLARVVAWECCPEERRSLLPDLIQEASLCLVQFAASFDYTSGENFTAWATVALRSRVRRAIGDDRPVRVPRSTRSRLRKAGRLADLDDALQPLSLDKVYGEDEECTLYWFISEPATPSRDREQDAQKRATLEAWLAQMSPLAQQVIRLSFGLCEEDGRAQRPGEIAALLGVTPKEIASLKQSALLKLKGIAEGRARGKRPRTTAPSPQCATASAPPTTEKQAQLERAALYLQREGQPITPAHLARLAEVSFLTAEKFLRRRGRSTEDAVPSCAERLEAAYTCLQTSGKHLTAYALSKEADVHLKTAARFLAREGLLPVQTPQARCTEQLEEAYVHMQAEETALTISELARRAGVHPRTAQRFLDIHHPEQALRHTSKHDADLQTRLEHASAALQAQGKSITERALAQRAGVSRTTARRFLHPQPPMDKGRSCTERLADAYAQVQAEGKPITASSLGRVAQVHWSAATRFLQQRQAVLRDWKEQEEQEEVCYA